MALPRSGTFRDTSTIARQWQGRRPYQRWKRRVYFRKCKLCGRKSYGEYCLLCEYSLLQLDEIIRLYLEGTPPGDIDDAVAELDNIYYSNLRIRVFYNAACEAVHCAMVNSDSQIELLEPNFSAVPRPKVLSVLEESGIISCREEKIYAGPLLKKLIRLRLTKYGLSSPEFSKQLRIIYAILTLTITKTLLKHEEFIPQIVIGILRVISAHITRNLKSAMIPKKIPRSTWETGLKGMSPREKLHIEWDLLGLSASTDPRIFEDYDSDREQFISKECMVVYFEYIRTRIRERELERSR